MPGPSGIATKLRDLGAQSSYVTGEDSLYVLIGPNRLQDDVVRIMAVIYEADPTQSCRRVGQDEEGSHEFEFRPQMGVGGEKIREEKVDEKSDH